MIILSKVTNCIKIHGPVNRKALCKHWNIEWFDILFKFKVELQTESSNELSKSNSIDKSLFIYLRTSDIIRLTWRMFCSFSNSIPPLNVTQVHQFFSFSNFFCYYRITHYWKLLSCKLLLYVANWIHGHRFC